MSAVAIIPARMQSSRFPGKPLETILGMSMLQHCYERALLTLDPDSLYVATCDRAIADHVMQFGGNFIMTSADHETATGRVAEAVSIIERRDSKTFAEIIMIQGDEPLFPPATLGRLKERLRVESAETVGLMSLCNVESEIKNPDNVKVVTSVSGKALYFSRNLIPSIYRTGESPEAFIQNGILGFKRHALEWFLQTAPTPLEIKESVDMLRFLEHGITVEMLISGNRMIGVDTPEDLAIVEPLMREDPTTFKYL